ncbi:uncharacterized protein LOC113848310 [Abrus precatorius]|uniref:Uncharacterized protein LOC113848310 n=1 Tax=Abrus precatorius TaxID=3816 RepID=A0A8B8JPY2_ABRPR|nr:uncharacterized protein LOC113848310 [Abrus precatorius]
MVDAATSDSPKRQPNGFIVTISAIIALLTKGASRVKGKPKPKPAKEDEWKIELKSPKLRPKKLLSNISSKALFGHNNQKKKQSEEENAKEEWGNGGVWQKEILMGGKCEPLDFSGVIYYDINGKQTAEVPLRSPRASPMPGYLTRR